MNLGIDLHALFPGKIGGGEQYIRNLIQETQKHPDIRLFLFLNADAINTFDETNHTQLFLIHINQDIDTQLSFFIDYLNIDIWFCPLFHLQPERCDIPSVVMIFDIQQEYFPRNFRLRELYLRKKRTKHTVRNADMLLTISEFSKSTLIEKYNVDSERIRVTWLDSDQVFMNPIEPEDKQRAKSTYLLPDEYIYYPANTWPHKNHLRLLKAYNLLKKKNSFTPKLLFTGAMSGAHEKIDRYIRKNDLLNDTIYLGYVPQEDMPCIFACASMLVFPSLFEGFGIPLIEAMRTKTPIVCSNSTSLPEIAGDSACYFNGQSVKDISDKILKVCSDSDLRNHLVEEGARRLELFSWNQCAEDTLMYLSQTYEANRLESVVEDELPLVSVITPSYNQGQFIKETIDSVLSQDYPKLEYIVIDGGSTDDTVDILKSYGDRITWVSEKDDGQADAINKGLEMAKGTIIGWLNSDDTYTEGAIETAVDYLLTHPNTGMVYGEGYYIDKDSAITGRYDTEKYSISRLAETCFICQPSAFFRKCLVDEVGRLDASLHLCMDYDLWMRFAFKGKISYIPDYLACSRMYEENKTSSRRKEVYKEVCATVKKQYGYLPFQWAYGYADQLMQGSRGWRFRLLAVFLFFINNLTNPVYVIVFVAKQFVRIIIRILPDAPFYGQYVDKWVSKEYSDHVMSRGVGVSIRIIGQHHWPMDTPLCIDILIDDLLIGSISILEKGSFERDLVLETTIKPGLHKIVLIANEVFAPSKMGIGDDNRKLSYVLESVEVLQ